MPEFLFSTTHIGSVPHLEPEAITKWLLDNLDVPAWTQLPQLDFRENMYIQFSSSLPSIVLDEAKQKVYFDTTIDLSNALEDFYKPIIADANTAIALHPEFARGFYSLLNAVKTRAGQNKPLPRWVKGQVTGPISFGLTVTEKNLRACIYNETLLDVIVMNTALTARWQVQQLKSFFPNILISIDEPYMSSVGSAFINLARDQVVAMLNQVIEAIHSEGALASVHCCGNTDWSILMETEIDVLNIDAYNYLESLSLYPAELRRFMDRGGGICWGIVPNNEMIFEETGKSLAERLLEGFSLISRKASARNVRIDPVEFYDRSLLAPACGVGSRSVEIATKTFEELVKVGDILKSTPVK